MKNRNFKRTNLIIVLLLIINYPIFSQTGFPKFGKVAKNEVEMTVFQADTAAEAVVLHSQGASEIDYIQNLGFVLRYTVYKRIKILKKEGLSFGNVEIELSKLKNEDPENIEMIKAQTYNMEEGKVVESKLEKKEIFTEDVSEYTELRKFAMPNVKVGSVIEYTYSIISELFYLRTWFFQSTIPVIYSQYKTSIPEYFEFNRYLSNYHTPTKVTDDRQSRTLPNGNTYLNNEDYYIFENLSAFKNEEYVSSPVDFLAKIEFDLKSINVPGELIRRYTGTWEEIIKHLLEREDFGAALSKHGIVKELSEKINATDAPEKKLADCYSLLQKEIKWNEYYSIYAQTNLRAAYNKKKGNVAEINLLLVNLLNSVDIEAYPVLLSTRKNGKVNMFIPRVSNFNYVVALAKINDKEILIDASQELLKIGELTYECMNGQGLVAKKGTAQWINLRNTESFSTANSIMVNVVEDKLVGSITKTSNSLSARSLRKELNKTNKEQYIEEITKNKQEWEIEEYIVENDTNTQKPLVEKIKIKNFNNIDFQSDMVYIPAVIVDDEIQNPFESETRKYPIDFGTPIKTSYIINFKVPANYVVEELPENVNVAFENNDALFVYKIQNKDNLIQALVTIEVRKMFFLPDEYENLRQFYMHISEKFNEQIVLKKI